MTNMHPIVFIRAEFFVNYTKGLIESFPDEELCKTPIQEERHKLPVHDEPCHQAEASENYRRLRDPNYQNEDLPDLNVPLDFFVDEEASWYYILDHFPSFIWTNLCAAQTL